MAKSEQITDRIASIAAQIRGACVVIAPDVDMANEHRDEANRIAADLQVSRIDIMSQVAGMSSAGSWTSGEVEKACQHAAKMSNAAPEDRSAKTVATFISEMRNVASPKVRDKFADILRVCNDVWQAEQDDYDNAEKEDKKNVPMPVRKWRTRKYHLISQIARDVRADKFTDISPSGLIAYAIANDPDHDAERIERRLKAMRDQLQAMYDDFAYDDFKTMVDFIADATAEVLKASRNEMLARSEPAQAPIPVTVTATHITPVVSEPAEGACDFLNDVLNDSDDEENEVSELLAA
jgi:hypothetical protein